MRIPMSVRVLLASLWMMAGVTAWAQSQSAGANSTSVDLAVTYSAERAELEPGNCGCFWLQGGEADLAVTLWKGIGVAASLAGGHASNLESNVNLGKIVDVYGPRYTYTASRLGGTRGPASNLQIFAQAMFGNVHGFDSIFPAGSAITSSANAFALQTGGGVNLLFSGRFGVRLFEAEYVRTTLPNNAANVQNDLRLAAGVTYHFGR